MASLDFRCMESRNGNIWYSVKISCWKILHPEKNISESYTIQEYLNEIQDELKKYNIRPLELNKLLNSYEDQILANMDSGQFPKTFVDKIVKELELDSGGFSAQKMSTPKNPTIKYL